MNRVSLRSLGGCLFLTLGVFALGVFDGRADAQPTSTEFLVGPGSDPAVAMTSNDELVVVYVAVDNSLDLVRPLDPGAGVVDLTSGAGTYSKPAIVPTGAGEVTAAYEFVFNSMINGVVSQADVLAAVEMSVGVGPGPSASDVILDTNGVQFGVAYTRASLPDPEIIATSTGVSGSVAAFGASPTLAVGLASTHLVYTRSGDLFQTVDSGTGFGAEELLLVGNGDPIDRVVADLDDSGVVHVVYRRPSGYRYRQFPPSGVPGTEVMLNIPSDATDLHLRVSNSGIGADVAYISAGDVFRITGAFATFGLPQNLTGTVEAETNLDFDFGNGIYQAVYEREGDIYWRTGQAPLVASFDFVESAGSYPPVVLFDDTSTGNVDSYLWEFGDGLTSTEENPEHTYVLPGSYTPSLTVTGPLGTSTVTASSSIVVAASDFALKVDWTRVQVGQEDVYLPVTYVSDDPLQGFQFAVKWPADTIDVQEISIDFSASQPLAPEFVFSVVDPVLRRAAIIVSIEFDPPFTGAQLPAAPNGRRLANLLLDVLPTATPGDYFVEFDTARGIDNVFSIGAVGLIPDLVPGPLQIEALTDPLPFLFLRGDFNSDLILGLQDATSLLAYLFAAAAPPGCFDAADFDNNGMINLTDVIGLLNFLFSAGTLPAPPYPNVGLDSIADSFPSCD